MPSTAVTHDTPATQVLPALPGAVTPRVRKRHLWLGGIVLVVAAILVTARVWSSLWSPPPTYTVSASGRIEGREVTLAPKDIQGRVKRLFADEGQTVTKGQVLAELDAAQLDARHASLSAAVAQLDAQISQAILDTTFTAKSSNASIAAAEAAVSSARARLIRAQAVLARSAADRDRTARLFQDAIISQQEMDQADMTWRTSEADVEAATKDLHHAEADLALARASTDTIALKRQQVRVLRESRRAAVAQLAESEANLAERQIVAPIDGTILSRPVEVGDVVSPGSPVFQMVDMKRLYVKVYIPEPDIPKLKLGDPADVSVDAFPGRRFAARISKISDQAEFTPKNVETVEERLKLVFGVELTFIDPNPLLKPGMPADCVVHWSPGESHEDRHGS